jgi:protein gp37
MNEGVWTTVTGCVAVSEGCKGCAGRLGWAMLAADAGSVCYGRRSDDVRIHPGWLTLPLRWQAPRLVSVNPLSDLFHDAVPDNFIADVFKVMSQAPQHTFLLLTKRPERMGRLLNGWAREKAPFYGGETAGLPNLWLGVAVENQAWADVRVPWLMQTPAVFRWAYLDAGEGLTYVPPIARQLDRVVAGPAARLGVHKAWLQAGGPKQGGVMPVCPANAPACNA